MNNFSFNKNSFLLVISRCISDYSAFLNMVAMSSYIYFLSNSSINVGIFLACRVLGGILASLSAPVIFSLVKGKLPLIILDIGRALALLLLLLPVQYHLVLLPFIGLFLGLCSSLFSIGLNSQLETFVGKERLGQVNSWSTTFSSIGMVLGAVTSGLMIAFFDYELVIIFNAVTYTLAACCISLLITPKQSIGNDEPQKVFATKNYKEDWQQLRAGLKHTPVITAMLVVTLADTLGSAAHNVGFPIISALFDEKEPAKIMGYIIATWAVGKLIGATFVRKIGLVKSDRLDLMEKGFFLGVFIMSCGFIVAFNLSTISFSLIAFMVAGLGDGMSEVTFITRAQNSPNNVRLPLFSLITLMQTTGFGVGMLICAFAFEVMSPAHVVTIFHCIPLLVLFVVGAVKVFFMNKKAVNKNTV